MFEHKAFSHSRILLVLLQLSRYLVVVVKNCFSARCSPLAARKEVNPFLILFDSRFLYIVLFMMYSWLSLCSVYVLVLFWVYICQDLVNEYQLVISFLFICVFILFWSGLVLVVSTLDLTLARRQTLHGSFSYSVCAGSNDVEIFEREYIWLCCSISLLTVFQLLLGRF